MSTRETEEPSLWDLQYEETDFQKCLMWAVKGQSSDGI